MGSYVLPHRPRVAVGGTIAFTLSGLPSLLSPASADADEDEDRSGGNSSSSGGGDGVVVAKGAWSSEDPGILWVDAATGLARGMSAGASTVRREQLLG